MHEYQIEKTFTNDDNLKPSFNGPLIVLNLIGIDSGSPNASVALIYLNGVNRRIKSSSIARYFVLSGSGTFLVWNILQEATVLPVKKGDWVRIPQGIPYMDVGQMVMLSINNPAYDPDCIEVLE